MTEHKTQISARTKALAAAGIVFLVAIGVLAGVAFNQTQGVTERVTKIESGIAQKCVRHAEANRPRSKACQRLLDALLKYATPAQREAITTGAVVTSGGQGSSSGLAGRSPGRSNPRGKAKGHR